MVVGHWVHSHEEDGRGHRVLRRAGTALPPSRGRFEYTITPELIAHCSGPGPDDLKTGHDSVPVQLGEAGTAPPDALIVIDARPDRLLIAK